jgi:hypothetical protein
MLRRRKRKEPDFSTTLAHSRRGRHLEPWNDEKEMTRSMSSVFNKVKKGGHKSMSKRNLRQFRSILTHLGDVDEDDDEVEGAPARKRRTFTSVLGDPNLSSDEAVKRVQSGAGRHLPKSHVHSIDSGTLGALVSIPNTPTQVRTPARIVVAGPSMCGKTHLVKELLRQRDFIFQPTPPHVFWFYAMEDSVTKARDEFEDITFIKNLPTEKWVRDNIDPSVGALFVIDDLMGETTTSGRDNAETRTWMGNMFTKGSHHTKVSIIFTVQNLFRGSYMREISLNASQTVAFNNPRDMGALRALGTQLFPPECKGSAFITACMSEIRTRRYGYLWIDHPAMVESTSLQFRTSVLRGEDQEYFVHKDSLDDVDPSTVTSSKPLNSGRVKQ